LAIHRVEKAALRAFADVALGLSIIIYGFRLVQQPGQRAWVSSPQREWVGDDGKHHYAPIVELSGALKTRVEQAILQAWEAEEGRHGEPR
jgi:DNA-binding cell septation regulator SpoVG